MRLDHLLSRESSQGRDTVANFQVDRYPKATAGNERNRARRRKPEAGRRKRRRLRNKGRLSRFSICIVFNVPEGIERARRKPGRAHLDNRTTEEREKTLKKKVLEGQLRDALERVASASETMRKKRLVSGLVMSHY